MKEMELSKAKIKLYSSLAMKKHRQAEGLFVVEGTKCVLDTFNYFLVEAVVATNDWYEQHVDINLPEDRCLKATHKQLEQISSLSTAPDVVGIYRIPDWKIDYDLINEDLTLVLDGVQDPGNLGTIMRIADWFGIRQIIASNDTVDVFNTKTIQATMGAISRVKVFYVNLIDFLSQQKGLPIYGTLLDGKNIYESELANKGLIIMGNEGKGISEDVRKFITNSLLIPAYPIGAITSESLNVGVATAITISEFRRRSI